MRVFLAGASGAIGRELIPRLIDAGHEVVGLTRTVGALAGTGAEELVANVRDRPAFLRATSALRVDAVINQLTALRKAPTRYSDMVETNRLRSEGTNTLIAAARAMGATRLVSASVFYGYGFADHGEKILDEWSPFGEESDEVRLNSVMKALLALEQQTHAVGGVSLRYGLFYSAASKPVPFSTDWDGVLPYVDIRDAADATALALESGRPGAVYNIVDDDPASWRAVNESLAHAQHSRAVGLRSWMLAVAAPFGSNLMARTSMRVSNDLAKQDLGWQLAHPSYRDALSVVGGT